MRARCSSCACTTSALALARAADSRRRASATSLSTALMLRLLKVSPRSCSLREQASLMITAKASSSPRANTSLTPAGTSEVVAAGEGAVRALKSWSRVRRFMARRPAEESTSVRVESWSAGGFEKNLFAAVITIESLSPTLTMAGFHVHLYRGRSAIGIHIGSLVGDVNIHINGLSRDHLGGGEEGNDPGLAGAAVNPRRPSSGSAHQQYLAGIYRAVEGIHDDGDENNHR